ncbi:hypothetical protein R3P38DRAFT_2697531, partial [Favolaschia claudopus]
MAFETDSQEIIELSSDTVVGQMRTTTIHVSGGIGGQGGRGGQEGGTGGKGEAPTFNISGPVGRIVHVSDRDINTDGLHKISLCDIYLQREVYLDNPQLCFWQRCRRKTVRRYHTAEVKDRKQMTVIFYEGKNAEEEFKKDVARSMKFRHPSFFQLYGTVHSENVHASIFYDVLIPWRDIERIYRPFPMVFCYIYTYVVRCIAASQYFEYRFGSTLYSTDCTFFLRPSTGRLCIDLEGFDYQFVYRYQVIKAAMNILPMSLLSTIDTQIIIDALTIEQYHKICWLHLTCIDRHATYPQLPLTATVHLGGVYHTGHHDLGNFVAAPSALDIDECLDRAWRISSCWVGPHIMENGWNGELGEKIDLYLWVRLWKSSDLWFSQANHVLNRLGVFSNADNYALLNEIWFKVELDPQPATPTDWHSLDAFLFLCPPQSLRVGPASFKCPECVGYWSFDPSGEDRISSEQAAELGFPTISISIDGAGKSWTDAFYAGLRQFHQGKGFDPDSQDLARHLGYPLYELSPE